MRLFLRRRGRLNELLLGGATIIGGGCSWFGTEGTAGFCAGAAAMGTAAFEDTDTADSGVTTGARDAVG